MRIFIILLFLVATSLSGIAIAADMVEMEAIRAVVGPEALIIPVPDYNCNHIYVVKKADGSIWTYYSSKNGKYFIIHKALIFQGEKKSNKALNHDPQ